MILRRAFVNGRQITHGLSKRLCAPLPTYSDPSAPFYPRYVGHAHATIHTQSPTSPASPTGLHMLLHEEVEQFYKAILASGRPPRSVLLTLERSSECITAQHPILLEEPARNLLEAAIVRISQSTFPKDQKVFCRVVRIAARLLHVEVPEYVSTVFTRIISGGDVSAALDWLCGIARMSELHLTPMLPLWHQLLEKVAQSRNDCLLSMCLKKMSNLSVRFTPETGRLIFTALLRSPSYNSPPSYEIMKHAINLLSSTDLAHDEEIGRLILDVYTETGETNLGRRIQLLYFTIFAKRNDKMTEGSMHNALAFLSSQGDREKVVRQYRRFRKLGLHPSDNTLRAVMGDSATLANLEYWRRTLGIRGGSRTSTKVMKHIVNREALSSQKVLAFYRSECQNGISPSSDMLHLAIHTLLSSGLEKPSDVKVDAAVSLYREYTARQGLMPKTDESPEGTGQEDSPSSPVDPPNARTYQLLLRALTSMSDMAKNLPVAVSLVEDMRHFHVQFDPQSTASVLVLLMRSSSTTNEAFEMYRIVACPVDKEAKPVLNDEGYNAVLHTFCSLPIWPNGVPSTRHYFEIVADMRKHGFKLNAKAYTIILRQLATLATTARPGSEVREMIAKSITRVHNHLTVNTGFTPDTPLRNQLMDAYQRAGRFVEAFRVWQQLFTSRQFTNTSVSIILDACAFAKAYDSAVRVHRTLSEIGYPLNLQNWNTFLECLCRVDKLDEAMKVLCLEMSGRDDGIGPDVESVRILLKFAAKKNQETEVLSRVKRFLPKLYYTLPDNLRLRY